MIAFLKGTIEDITENSLVLDVNGIGYEVLVPGQLLDMLKGIGQELKVNNYIQVLEDAVVKAGLGILSALGTEELRFAVLADDAKRIAKAPGIGAKTAQKIILELKDKLDLAEVFEQKLNADRQQEAAVSAGSGMVQDAVEALVALGYGSTEALRAVRAVKADTVADSEQLLKEALKHML